MIVYVFVSVFVLGLCFPLFYSCLVVCLIVRVYLLACVLVSVLLCLFDRHFVPWFGCLFYYLCGMFSFVLGCVVFCCPILSLCVSAIFSHAMLFDCLLGGLLVCSCLYKLHVCVCFVCLTAVGLLFVCLCAHLFIFDCLSI